MGEQRVIDEEKGEGGYTVDNENRSNSDTPETPRSATSNSSGFPLIKSSFARLRTLSNSWRKSTSQPESTNSEDGWDPASSQETIIRKVHEMPLGYPKMATFLDSEDIFSIYRRFGYLQSRLILEKQDELRRLEQELDYLDTTDNAECQEALRTRAVCEGEEPPPQQILLQKIETKFLEYANLLQASQALMAFNKPTAHEHSSVRAWLDNAMPVAPEEQDFIHRKEDLITLRPGREHAWLDSIIESGVRRVRCKPVTWLFRSKETQEKSDEFYGEYYFTRSRIELCANSIITVMILFLLIVPIYILYRLTSSENSGISIDPTTGNVIASSGNPNYQTNVICIGVLIISTLLFSASITLFTRARRHEILAASAGYCAVLVVFIGNVGGGNSA